MAFPEGQPNVINGQEVELVTPTNSSKPLDTPNAVATGPEGKVWTKRPDSKFQPTQRYEYIFEQWESPNGIIECPPNADPLVSQTPHTRPQESSFWSNTLNTRVYGSVEEFATAASVGEKRQIARSVAFNLTEHADRISGFDRDIQAILHELQSFDPLQRRDSVDPFVDEVTNNIAERAKNRAENYLSRLQQIEARLTGVRREIFDNTHASNEIHDLRLTAIQMQRNIDEARIRFSEYIGSFFALAVHDGSWTSEAARETIEGIMRGPKTPMELLEIISSACLYGLDNLSNTDLIEYIADTATGQNNLLSEANSNRLARAAVASYDVNLMSLYVACHNTLCRFYRLRKDKEKVYLDWLTNVIVESALPRIQRDAPGVNRDAIMIPSSIYDEGGEHRFDTLTVFDSLHLPIKLRIVTRQNLLRILLQQDVHREMAEREKGKHVFTYGLPGINDAYVITEPRAAESDQQFRELYRELMLNRLHLYTSGSEIPIVDDLSTATVLELIRPVDLDDFEQNCLEDLNNRLIEQVRDTSISMPLDPYGDQVAVRETDELPMYGVSQMTFRPEEDGKISVTVRIGNFSILVFFNQDYNLVNYHNESIPISQEAQIWWKALTLSYLRKIVTSDDYDEHDPLDPEPETSQRTPAKPHWTRLPVGCQPDPIHTEEMRRRFPRINIKRENERRGADGLTRETRFVTYRAPRDVTIDTKKPAIVNPVGVCDDLIQALTNHP